MGQRSREWRRWRQWVENSFIARAKLKSERVYLLYFSNHHLWRPGAVQTLRSSVWIRFCVNIQANVKNVQHYAILGNKHILRCWLFHEFARLGLMSDDDAWACKCRLTKKGCQQHQKYLSVSVISRLFAYSIFVFIFFMNYNHAKKLSFTDFKSSTCTRKRGTLLPLPDAETPGSGIGEFT